MGEAKRKAKVAAATPTPLVEPKDWQPFPPGTVLGTVVLFSGATVRGGMDAAMLKDLKPILDKCKDTAYRSSLKDFVVQGIRENKHMESGQNCSAILNAAACLALTSDAGPVIQILIDAQPTILTYEITPIGDPSEENYNWRMMMQPMKEE